MAGTIITKKGLQLIAKLVASGTAMTFSRVSVGTGAVPAGYDPGSMTDLNQYKMDGSISSCGFLEDEASIIMQISSLGVETGFTITETGLFATDPDEGEILYAYLDLTKDPQYVYAENSAISKFVEITLVVKVGTVERVTAQLNPRSLLTRDGDISDTSINDLEPIDTKYPVPSAGESTKVFMGKVKKYIEDTKPLDADMAVYVATTGNDTTGDGTSAKPYGTINYALSTIPKNLCGYAATIFVADGTYDEAVFISGFTNGAIRLRRNGNIELNSLCNVSSVKADSCDTVIVFGINFITNSVISVHMSRCNYAHLDFCQSIASAVGDVASFVFDYVSTGRITNSKSLNHTVCLKSYLSTVISSSWVDSLGSVNGIYVDGGQIAKGNIFQPKGLVSNENYVKGSIVSSVFGANISTLNYDLTLYVATTGSDTTGNGTNASPFKTIQRAVDIIPKDLGGCECIINVADGTYDEDLLILCFANGVLRLHSPHTVTVSENCKINSIVASHNSCYLFITGFNVTTKTNTKHGIDCYNDKAVVVRTCLIAGASKDWAGIRFAECDFQVYDSSVSNKGIALHAYKSIGVSGWWTNSNNNGIGLYSMIGSTIKKIATQPNGTIMESQDTGGAIFNENGTQISEAIRSGVSCTWAILSGSYIRHGNLTGPAMITLQFGMTTSSGFTIAAGIEYQITGLPRPYTNTSVTLSPQGIIENCWLDTAGVLHCWFGRNLDGPYGMLINATYRTNE
jgi:hypothetical protein